MPMGAEVTGRMAHAADRRWRSPDVQSISLGNLEEAVDERADACQGLQDAGEDQQKGIEDAVSASGLAWESTLDGAIRLSPAEQMNPAFVTNPASLKAARSAYGGRGPRYGEEREGDRLASTPMAGGSGRWVRTGGCGMRWIAEEDNSETHDDKRYWRWVTAPNEQACDHDGEEGPVPLAHGAFRYLENGDGTVTLVSYDGESARVAMPTEIDGMTVTVLGASLFSNHIELESVDLPANLKVIDEHAFDGCSSLARVDLPNTLEGIGMLAFAKTGIESLSVPPSVQFIGDKAFFHCKRLASVELVSGLRAIGEFAFTYSGVKRVIVPATVELLGFNAFDLTPAQKHVGEGTICIDSNNTRYRFDGAGLYCDGALIELIGYVSEYEVAPGTRRIAEGACKRHPTLSRIHLPEGLIEIGDEAFRSNRCFRELNLPDTLERIGARAFVDTSVAQLHIPRSLISIGEDALLVQGEAQMNSRTPLSQVDVDPRNPVYYIQNGLLCERGSSPDGGDTCLHYVGPDAVVSIPDQVTNIAVMAFGGAVGVDELYVHNHIHSFCYGWLSMKESLRCVHVDFGEPIDGCAHGDFPLPALSTRFRYMTDRFSSSGGKTVFDFEYYDAWVTCSGVVAEMAMAAYGRLKNPIGMSDHMREVYEGIFERKGQRMCRHYAEHSRIDALEFLVDGGWIGLDEIESELDIALRDGRPQATACLLEMKHRLAPDEASSLAGGLDFSL